MTLGEAKRKVLMLIDEYSSGGTVTTDADIAAKMCDFFDMAQKDLALVEKLTGFYNVVRVAEQTEYAMPAGFRSLRKVRSNGADRTGKYRWKGKSIIIPTDDTSTVEIEYYKTPTTIAQNSADSTTFEVSEEAAVACCYYVASKQLIVDLVTDYSALEAIYQQMRQQLERQSAAGGPYRIRQGLFQRG